MVQGQIRKGEFSQRLRAKIKREFQSVLKNVRQSLKQHFPWKRIRSISLRYFTFQDPIDCIFYAFSFNKQPYFIQIGSNDGINGDPLYEFILKWNWSGIKTEPVRYIFDELQKNFQEFSTIVLENSAISKENESQRFYYLRQDENSPQWYSQIGSFSLPTLLKHAQWIPDLQERLMTSEVACLTFEALCQKHHIHSVDVIHIDTEGYDFEIIKLIDFQMLQPTIVLYEHKHLSETDRRLCDRYLSDQGYQLLSTPRDTLAILESKCDRPLKQAWNFVRGKV